MQKFRTFLLLLTIIIFCFLAFLPKDILYAKQGILKWTPFILIFILIPLLFLILMKLYKTSHNLYAFYPISLLFSMPVYAISYQLRSSIDLNLNGIYAKGVVHKRSEHDDMTFISCQFKYLNKIYSTYGQEDKLNQYNIGDTLTIYFSSVCPDNNKITELE